MKKLILLFQVLISLSAFGQKTPTKEAQPIVEEGKLLYRSEMASWYGTELFLEKYSDRDNIGGYFSYSEKEKSKCIFFSKNENPKVIGMVTFDSSYSTKKAIIDLEEREFSETETNLYKIRKIALDEINTDTLFKVYNNTNLNLIPLINGKEKKVYVLTGPQKSGVVIFGNDYLLTFDKDNKLLLKKELHKNILPFYYGGEDQKNYVGSTHNHSEETGDFITATDICTLMLYSPFAKWKSHNVVSRKYLNIWNCETNQLTVVPTGSVKSIVEEEEKKKTKE